MRRPALFHIIFLATEPIAGQGHGQGAFLGTLKMPRDFKGTLAGGRMLYSILYSVLYSMLCGMLCGALCQCVAWYAVQCAVR